jgi:hypothetical protein
MNGFTSVKVMPAALKMAQNLNLGKNHMTNEQILEARLAFVSKMKADNLHRDLWCRPALVASHGGKLKGFADLNVNRRWTDFKDGWEAALTLPAARS